MNPDWSPIVSRLDEARAIVITSHISPDGDALGSERALLLWLNRRGRNARVVNADPIPHRYNWLDPDDRIETFDPVRHAELAGETDLLVILDVSRIDRIGTVGRAFAGSKATRIVIDHHPGEADFPAAASIIAPDRAATGELIAELMESAGSPPDRAMASALYVAIMTDTGSFRHASTTPRTHRIAATLLEAGVEPSLLHDLTWNRNRDSRMRLFGEALLGYERGAGGALVVASLPLATLERHGATPPDTDGLAEFLRGVEGCRVVALFTESEAGKIKVSLRSRGALDVNAVARKFGGGGHVNAAGIPAKGTLDEVRRAVTLALEEAIAATPEPRSAAPLA